MNTAAVTDEQMQHAWEMVNECMSEGEWLNEFDDTNIGHHPTLQKIATALAAAAIPAEPVSEKPIQTSDTSPRNEDWGAALGLQTTVAMRSRIRELSERPAMDDHDRAVLMLLDDFARCMVLLGVMRAAIPAEPAAWIFEQRWPGGGWRPAVQLIRPNVDSDLSIRNIRPLYGAK